MISKIFRTKIVCEGSMCFIPLNFDPKPVFGKVRAPVEVTLNGYTYRSTIAAMGGPPCIPLRKSHREAAGLQRGDTVTIRLDLDTDKREVKPPPDLRRALRQYLEDRAGGEASVTLISANMSKRSKTPGSRKHGVDALQLRSK